MPAFKMMEGGRGSGKTFSVLSTIYDYCMKKPNARCVVYMASGHNPYTLSMYMANALLHSGGQYRSGERMFVHRNGSRVCFVSSEEEMRGLETDIVFLTNWRESTGLPDTIRRAKYVFIEQIEEFERVQPVTGEWGVSLLDTDKNVEFGYETIRQMARRFDRYD